MSEHQRIWLEPVGAPDRCWCSDNQWDEDGVEYVLASDANVTIKGLEADRDAAIDRAKVWEFNWRHEVKVKGEVVSWVKDYQERLAAAEAERDAMRKALKPFADAVFNDNGDMTVNLAAPTSEDFIAAYFCRRAALKGSTHE